MGERFSVSVQTGPGAHPATCTMGTGSFPGVKSSRGVTLTPHPLLVPWSRKSRAVPVLPLWAVRPVQSFSVCTKVHLTFILLYSHQTVPYNRPLHLPFSKYSLIIFFLYSTPRKTLSGYKRRYIS